MMVELTKPHVCKKNSVVLANEIDDCAGKFYENILEELMWHLYE